MQPGHIKLLLLIFLMLGVGGYVFYTTNPQPATQKKVAVKQAAPVAVPSSPAANVTNVHIDKQGTIVTISGVAKDAIDPSLTSLRFTGKTSLGKVEGSFDRMSADVFVDARAWKGGSITADLTSLTTGNKTLDDQFKSSNVLNVAQFPQATFVMTHIEKGEGRDVIAVGDVTLHGVKKEIRISFTRQGGGLQGSTALDLTAFGITTSGFENNRVDLVFSLGVK